MQKKPIVLLILDGFGHSDNHEHNSISKASTPNWDSLNKECANILINASESYVGLPSGQMGNSEVGHLNIGSGRVIHQDISRINLSIENKTFFSKSLLNENFRSLKKNNKTLHIFGLLSDGGVHSHIEHFDAVLLLAKQNNLEKVYVHAFLDGRDTPPKSAEKYIASVEKFFEKHKTGELASISGRFYSMDRDNRWERTESAFNLLVHAKAEYKVKSSYEAISQAYKRNETDEFVSPTLIEVNDEFDGISNNDTIVFMNFRSDRARQITDAILNDKFDYFDRGAFPKDLSYFTLTEYDKKQKKAKAIFEPIQINNSLGQFLSNRGKTQLRIAETEKYPHVTFFFNGGREQPFEGESRMMAHSPKVATYDLQPEMSAHEIVASIVPELEAGRPDFICLNFANPDMVGHTGVFDAIVKAVETTDSCLKQIVEAGAHQGYNFIIIADHGNADYARNPDGSPHTAHTTNPVPVLILSDQVTEAHDGILADVAPTVLKLMGVAQPEAMTGSALY